MSKPGHASHLPFAAEVFAEYEKITLPLHGRLDAQDKADGSAVTRADREASAHVLKRLNAYCPEHGVVSEEESESYLPGAGWQWAVDPLDGTASFARGLPVWGLGMGLLHEADPVAGYLYFPVLRQSFSFENGTALFNGEAMPVRPDYLAPDTLNLMITDIHAEIDVRCFRGYRLHGLGSTHYHLMMLAAGRCDAVVTGRCFLWDLAPALPFTRRLGYVERHLDGSTLDVEALMRPDYGMPRGQPLFVGPEALVEKLLKAATN
jgi:fructose-1,6-bisphosphatase/inositol monophosphatase family enzyme